MHNATKNQTLWSSAIDEKMNGMLFWGDPGQHGGFWQSEMGISHFVNSRNRQDWGL